MESGHAYYCFCTQERLDSLKRVTNGKEISAYDKHCLNLSKAEIQRHLDAHDPYVIRFNMPAEGTTSFHDEVFGDIEVDNAELDDLILIKSDGYPTYNFANVVDDHLMGVTHVVRGSEYLSSTPKYNRIYEAFGWEIPKYIHCPLITNEEKQKLSKRSGHSSYEDLVEQGFLPETIVNFVALLGWSPEDGRELFTLPELVRAFDYHRISKSPSVFDVVKLKWMNSEYLKAMEDERFYDMALPVLRDTLGEGWDFRTIARMVKSRIQTVFDIPDMVAFLKEVPEYDAGLYCHKKSKSTQESAREILGETIPVLEKQRDYSNDALFAALSAYAAEKGCKISKVMWPLRTALSGQGATPCGATEIMALLGKEETLKRLKAGERKLSESSGSGA